MKTYSEIVQIKAPLIAPPGAMVPVDITIKNTWNDYLHLYVYAYQDSDLVFWQDVWLGPSNTTVLYGSFPMPGKNVTVLVELYYESADGYLYLDDSQTKSVVCSTSAPQVSEFKIKDFVKV